MLKTSNTTTLSGSSTSVFSGFYYLDASPSSLPTEIALSQFWRNWNSLYRWRAFSETVTNRFRRDISSGNDRHVPMSVKLIPPAFEQTHSADAFIQFLVDKTHSADALIQVTVDQTHSADAVVVVEKTHFADAFVIFPVEKSHQADAFVFTPMEVTHSADASILITFEQTHSADAVVVIERTHQADASILIPTEATHSADAFLLNQLDQTHSADAFLVFQEGQFAKLFGEIQFPITDPNFLKVEGSLLLSQLESIKLAGELLDVDQASVGLRGTLDSLNREHVKLEGSVVFGNREHVRLEATILKAVFEFVNLEGTLVGQPQPDACQNFPDSSFVKLGAWLVSGDPNFPSVQMPGTDFEDFDSSLIAAAAYRPISIIKLDGHSLIVTNFTAGVVSFQTRTRQWLRRVDAAPSGILVSTQIQERTLPNGQKIRTTTERRLVKDSEIVTVKTQNLNTPERTTVQVTERNKFGREITRTVETQEILGIRKTLEKRTVDTSPPTTDNIQPIRVKTLDGIEHFQWFGQVNPDFAGGAEEGTTVTERAEQIVPSELDGQTVDQFGNPILAKVTDETVTRPDGSVQQTHTEVIGVEGEGGTTVTDEEREFDGQKTITRRVVNHPNGSKTITESIQETQDGGDSVETEVEIVTDENGVVTTTNRETRTQTIFDPALGRNKTIVTVTTKVKQGDQETTEVTTTTNDDFEDDIVSKKIKVFLVQEFTINSIIDMQRMHALMERHISHQTQFAKLELFGQQLGNSNLTWDLRQKLIAQFDEAASCLAPMELQALGRTYEVVFAPSGSAFRANYVAGTEPHVYSLQMILQQRSDLITGSKTF